MTGPFPCITCSKSFTRNADLNRHNARHTGYRPFVCGICGHDFIQRNALKIHEHTHSRDKPWHCGIGKCKSRFGDPSSQSRHRREVHGKSQALKYKCPTCDTEIKRKSSFKTHLRLKHGLIMDGKEIDMCLDPACSSLSSTRTKLKARGTRARSEEDSRPAIVLSPASSSSSSSSAHMHSSTHAHMSSPSPSSAYMSSPSPQVLSLPSLRPHSLPLSWPSPSPSPMSSHLHTPSPEADHSPSLLMIQDGQCGMGLGAGAGMSMATSALDHGMHGPYTQNSLGFDVSYGMYDPTMYSRTDGLYLPLPSEPNFFNAYTTSTDDNLAATVPTTTYGLDMHLDQSSPSSTSPLDYWPASQQPAQAQAQAQAPSAHEFRESDWVDLNDDYAALSPLPIFSLTEDGASPSSSSSGSSSLYSTPGPVTPKRLASPLNLPGSPAVRARTEGCATPTPGYGAGRWA